MDKLQVGYQSIVHVLIEERSGIEGIEGGAIGQLNHIKLLLLGDDSINVRGQERISLGDACTDGTLRGGLQLGARAWGDAGHERSVVQQSVTCPRRQTNSFLNIFEWAGTQDGFETVRSAHAPLRITVRSGW